MRILLAEDNAIVRKAVAAGLVADGYEVEQAEDGELALSLAHSTHPDLILSDVLMPNMDGFSLCQAVRSDHELHDIPVVFYSATFLEPEDEELARQVGASGFILKDSDLKSFHDRVHNVIESERQHKPPLVEQHSEHLGEENRLYRKALTSKLLKKVTELEAEKRALRESRQFLDYIVTTIPDVVFVLGLPEMEISYIAPQAERLLGIPGDELMGSSDNWRALIDDSDRERVERELNRAVETQSGTIITCRMHHKKDGVRWIEGRISPRRTDNKMELVGALTDVTERFEKDEQIRQSESRLNTLFSNLPGMAYRCDNQRDWNMEFVSNGVMELTGYRRDELENSQVVSYADIIHPQDREMVWDVVQQALREGRQFSFVYRILHKDGSVRWVWERGVGIKDEEDEDQHIEGFISDITLRKQAEEKLISSEQRFRSLFEMMESGMAVHELVYDANGKANDYRFLEVNPAFERMTGLKAGNVVGRTVREALPGIEEEWINDYVQVAQSGVSAGFVRYAAALDKYFQVIAYQTKQDQFATIFTDISEQRKAEQEIQSLARFPAENPNPVIRIAASGEILYLNPASEKLLVAYRDEYAGLRDVMILMAKKALEINELEKLDYVVGARHFTFVITPFKESGYVNLYGRDVTKQVLATQQLQHTNRVLRTLSQGNRTMIHATSEVELLQNVCDVLSNDGDYLFVWAAYSINNRLVPQVQSSNTTEPMQRWLGDLEQVDLDDDVFAGLYDESATILLTEFEHGSWTMNQVDIAREIGLSTLLLLPIRYRQNMFGVIGIFSARREIFDESELSLLQEMAGDVAYGIESQRTHVAHGESMERIQKTMLQTIEAVSLTLEKRDPYTAGHQQRVVQLAVAIAQQLELDAHRIEGLRLAALVHDIGKINVPAEILNRPGRLSESEFGIIKSHPQIGYDILKGVEFDWPIADIVLQHHERCDGSGYPSGLQCEEIVFEARILAVADVVEAITSHRPYRPGLGLDVALDEIRRGCGTIYDETIVDTCLELFTKKGFTLESAQQ